MASFLNPVPLKLGSEFTLSAAEGFYNKIERQIRSIEADLAEGESITLTHAGPSGPCSIENMGFHGMDMMIFRGVDSSGRKCKLLVHLHAVNLMVAVVRSHARPRQIGFSGDVSGERT